MCVDMRKITVNVFLFRCANCIVFKEWEENAAGLVFGSVRGEASLERDGTGRVSIGHLILHFGDWIMDIYYFLD